MLLSVSFGEKVTVRRRRVGVYKGLCERLRIFASDNDLKGVYELVLYLRLRLAFK